jgi:hypothetical protein
MLVNIGGHMRYILWCIHIFYFAFSFLYALILFCDVKMCPEAAHFLIEPLQDEEDLRDNLDKKVATNVFARVPPSSKDQDSQPTTNIEAIEGSGYEGEEDSHVTPLHDKGRKKRSCTYSISPSTSPGMDVESSSRLDLLINITEKKEKI